MAGDLSEVFDQYLPPAPQPAAPRTATRAALPVLTMPVAGRDPLRAAFAWNLTVELARLGARAVLVTPRDADGGAFWPEPGHGPVGAEAVAAPADDLAGLGDAAQHAAERCAADAPEGGVVVACPPPAWLLRGGEVRTLLRWLLLFGRPEPRDLEEAYALAKAAYARGSDPLVGVTIHGAGYRDARRAFGRVSAVAARHLGRTPASYGLLADDLEVYRSIASRRPIGIEHPQSRAARALRDVARMLWDDARKLAVG